jgi:hypothetical protein
VKSAAITNRDSTPVVLSSAYLTNARIEHARGRVSIANGDSVGSKYLACTIPSSAVIVSVRMSAPDIGTTTAGDIGLYKTTKDGGAVVDADFFTAAVVLNAGAISKAEKWSGNIITIANTEKRVWEALGLAADPLIDYDVAITLTGAADAAGDVLVEVDYVR